MGGTVPLLGGWEPLKGMKGKAAPGGPEAWTQGGASCAVWYWAVGLRAVI